MTTDQQRSLLTFAVALPPAEYPLQLPARDFRLLFDKFGPSLGLWRAAEVAALRTQFYEPPVLDLGCGDGLVTGLVLDSVDIGLDPDGQALARAAALRTYRRLIPRPIENSGLPDGSIGTILSNSVLEHVPNIDTVLGAAARLLRPEGRLIFTVPTEAFGSWLALPVASYAGWRNRQLVHRNLWSTGQWTERLAAAGFEVETIRPYLRRPLVAAWDALELMQQVWIGRHRVFGVLWRRLPAATLDLLARRASHLVLDAPQPGGGRLVVARKVDNR